MCNRRLYRVLITGIIISSITPILSLDHRNTPCSPVGKCRCEFPNGLGVDLTLLRGPSMNISIWKGAVVSFYPCKNVQFPAIYNSTHINQCEQGVSMCLLEDDDLKLYSLGSLEESSFIWERITDEPVLVFHNANRTTNILLECNGNAKNPTLQFKSNSSNVFNFKLISDMACLRTVSEEGRSVFATMLIVFIVIFLAYLTVGFLVLRFIRGARGLEAIPNSDFWSSSYSSVKKFFTYIFNGCRHPETYDTI